MVGNVGETDKARQPPRNPHLWPFMPLGLGVGARTFFEERSFVQGGLPLGALGTIGSHVAAFASFGLLAWSANQRLHLAFAIPWVLLWLSLFAIPNVLAT